MFSPKRSFLLSLFEKIPSLSFSKKHSLSFLNISQFLGVINDNLFKFTMAFLLIHFLGQSQASNILSATGVIYVIPFLLFSSSAGILADRLSKQKLLVSLKALELLILSLAPLAFSLKSPWGCYTILFLLATHSALFGPSKYGIIAELVPSEKVSKANSLISSFTYLAMIIGTFLASFLTEITERNFFFISLICIFIALLGLFSALYIQKTAGQGSKKEFSPFFVSEIYRTLRSCKEQTHLLPAIFGSAFFLFIGAFTQLNTIPFALQSLHLDETYGGYLFLVTALGIALGSLLAGRVLRKKIDLGISCFAGLGISVLFLLLSLLSHFLFPVIVVLLGVGFLGGLFIVPFDTFVQLTSSNQKRGQTIGAANFLSFVGVFLAAAFLFLFSQVLGLHAATGFALIGIVTLFVSLFLSIRLYVFSLPLFGKYLLHPLLHFTPPSSLPKNLILENASCWDALLLLTSRAHVHLFIPCSSQWAFHLCSFLHPKEEWGSHSSGEGIFCLVLKGKYESPTEVPSKPSLLLLFKEHKEPPQVLSVQKDASSGKRSISCTH